MVVGEWCNVTKPEKQFTRGSIKLSKHRRAVFTQVGRIGLANRVGWFGCVDCVASLRARRIGEVGRTTAPNLIRAAPGDPAGHMQ